MKLGHLTTADIAFLRGWLQYNSTDLGELGRYVRLEYVSNAIDELVKRVELRDRRRPDHSDGEQ